MTVFAVCDGVSAKLWIFEVKFGEAMGVQLWNLSSWLIYVAGGGVLEGLSLKHIERLIDGSVSVLEVIREVCRR